VSQDTGGDRIHVQGPIFISNWQLDVCNGLHKTNIKQNLKAAQDKQKIYADKNNTHKEFKVGDHVFLKVKDNRSSLKLGSYAKLATRFCGPFEIMERIGPTAYMIALPASMSIHNVFHVSLLKKYIPDVNHVIYWNVIQVEQEGTF
jgi:exosome complex RNA-binding protein Rrp4